VKLSSKLILTFAIAVIGIIVGIGIFGILYFNETSQEVAEFDENTKHSKVYIYTTNSEIMVNVDVADTSQKQSQGLMFRENMKWNHGMLFIFDNETILSFWMKDTLIPLDMIFVDKTFRIINIVDNALPCTIEPCPGYSSEKPVKYVLEVNAGFVETNDIEVGDFISMNLNSSK
jgi:uncharacterized membrane protein (UPF0127 family)